MQWNGGNDGCRVECGAWEKSAALLNCIPYQNTSKELFKEFSDICSVPFFSIQCSQQMTMKNLMHVLNGAALGGVWILLEHIDRLDYTHLITLSKEVQMVQQQFIIAELSQDESSNKSVDEKDATHSKKINFDMTCSDFSQSVKKHP